MTAATAIGTAAGLVAAGLADVRWLRVAQREHYLPGAASRFALRWWLGFGPNRVLALAAVLGAVLSPLSPFSGVVGAAEVAAGPIRFPLRGRQPGPVVWTARLRTVAAATAGIQLVVAAAGVVVGQAVAAAVVAAVLAPAAVDAALALLSPIEDRRAQRFVDMATRRLAEVRPTIVGITGSYGKTSTKVYAAHLMQGSRTVVPTPASFNNRAGLSRAINEHLTPGTNVFVAEMGTYGPGEIAEMCAWCPPSVAAITAIGPVHLERFGSEDAIVRAKSEILAPADVAVLNVDDPRLSALAAQVAAAGKRVIRCSATDQGADVAACMAGGRLVVSHVGQRVADVAAPDAQAGNIAVAVALALAVGVPGDAIAARLSSLPPVANRGTSVPISTGATAIDDTFNSNPVGCRAALRRLERGEGKRVVVTPGMVELGPRQGAENRAFAAEAARVASHLIVVGQTNRPSLLAGARDVAEPRAVVLTADSHARAVDWVRANTEAGDIVLYENQLPDHYP